MSVAVAQDSQYLGDDRWSWEIWLTGSDEELDTIEAVEYRLHPTFLRPVRVVTDRETAFRLKASGWGTFEIGISIEHRDGGASSLKHQLDLAYPEEPTTRGEPLRTVFVSAGSADSDTVAELTRDLEGKGLTVLSADDDMLAGSSWGISIRTAIREADAVVAVVSDVPSSWAEQEIRMANSLDTPVIPLVVGERVEMPDALEGIQPIHIRDQSTIGPAADRIAASFDLDLS